MNDDFAWKIHSLIFDDIGFFTIFIGAIILIILMNFVRYFRIMNYPTFDEYRRKNPGAFQYGIWTCVNCGSRSSYIMFYDNPGSTRGPKRHICRGCGKILYRT